MAEFLMAKSVVRLEVLPDMTHRLVIELESPGFGVYGSIVELLKDLRMFL